MMKANLENAMRELNAIPLDGDETLQGCLGRAELSINLALHAIDWKPEDDAAAKAEGWELKDCYDTPATIVHVYARALEGSDLHRRAILHTLR